MRTVVAGMHGTRSDSYIVVAGSRSFTGFAGLFAQSKLGTLSESRAFFIL